MHRSFRPAIAVLASTAWISVNEFTRNQFVLQDEWVRHYQDLGLTFPGRTGERAVWGLWALLFSVAVLVIARTHDLLRTAALAWTMGFVLMWVVIGNLGVLPYGILPVAVPWSLAEAFGAAWIAKRLA